MRGRQDARPCPCFSRPCSAITSAAEPSTTDTSGCDRVGCSCGCRRPRQHQQVSRDERGRPCSPTSMSPSRRCASPCSACGSSWSRPAIASGATARSIDSGPMGSRCTSRCPVHHAALHGLNLRGGLTPVDILHRQARPPITQTRDRLRDRGRRSRTQASRRSSSRSSRPVNVRSARTERFRLGESTWKARFLSIGSKRLLGSRFLAGKLGSSVGTTAGCPLTPSSCAVGPASFPLQRRQVIVGGVQPSLAVRGG
jgi:hypothetical protein